MTMLTDLPMFHEYISNVEEIIETVRNGKMVATLFVVKNGQYIRATTTLKKEDGTRAVGTALDPGSPAAKALSTGQKYTGPITLFKRRHMASYVPVSFDDGTRGAVFVGIDYSSADDMLVLAHRMVYVTIVVGVVGVVLLAVGLAYAIQKILTNRLGAFISMAEGLAAGKGVVVAMTLDDAHRAIDDMLSGNKLGDAGSRVVIEEFLDGEEASFIVMVDGKNVLPLASSQDHKRIFDGDTGPNTGGMGAYSPAPVVTPSRRGRT